MIFRQVNHKAFHVKFRFQDIPSSEPSSLLFIYLPDEPSKNPIQVLSMRPSVVPSTVTSAKTNILPSVETI